MAADPGDQGAADAAASGHPRALHADREQVIDVPKAAFVQGRLTRAELDARVGQALVLRTYTDLAAVTADVPVGLADGGGAWAQARRPMNNAAKAGMCAVIAIVVAVTVSIPTGGIALFVFAPFYFMALLVARAQILASRHEKRSRSGQLPPWPGQFCQTLGGEQDSGPGNDLMLCQAHRGTRTRHLRWHSVIQRISRPVPNPRASPSLCT